uniref:RHO family interacting cell polarization regulator 1 n=1 Tax=Sphenodon punctatus TaxID=8508 RepID=A0A8D0HPJ5_SPHPU
LFITGMGKSQSPTYSVSCINLPAFSTPTVSRKSGFRVSRMFSTSHKSPPPKVPQPERLDEVYEALKKGLTAYLEVHQLELEKLNTQIRESKRNSRLVSEGPSLWHWGSFQIDELYEAYCIQRRLRDGAHNMVKAYTAASPGSKEARESLAEASKGYKEYAENMCLLESELESQLGEFHIKMRGTGSPCRTQPLCSTTIFMRYGRQRWKLRGRIEVNGKQLWDTEEMVFLPLITEFLSIKVTELKSLANHVVVGNVSCETKDLFAALPQVVAVDINDLGTIKLSLEVNWNPFDKDDQPSSASTVNKASTINKRFSTYNQSPPDTPSLREQAFYNMLRRQEELENGAAWSISSESSDDSSSPQLSGGARHIPARPIVQPALQAAAPAIEIAFMQPEKTEPLEGLEPTDKPQQGEGVARKEAVPNGHVPYARTLSHISEVSVDAAMAECREDPSPVARNSSTRDPVPLETNSVPRALDARTSKDRGQEAVPDRAVLQREGGEPTAEQAKETACNFLEVPKPRHVDIGLEEAIGALGSALDDYRGQFPELHPFERELKRLEEILLHRQGVCLSRASSMSLTVEHALESFSFLNASDMDDSEGEEEPNCVVGRAPGACEVSAEDTGLCVSPDPMSTGSEFLDRALMLHLHTCNQLLLKLGTFGPLRCREMYALDKLMREAQVLEIVCQLTEKKAGAVGSTEEVLPLWNRCVAVPNVYTCPVENFLQTFSSQYSARMNERQQGLADPVCVKLVEEILDHRLPKRPGSSQAEQITIFQYWNHFEALPVSTLDVYVLELAEEVLLVQNLNANDQDVVLKSLKHVPESRLRKDGLKALSSLLIEGNNKVIGAVSAQLRGLSESPGFRQRALVCYLDQLEDEEVQTRIAACAALGLSCWLHAKESIEQLVYVCQTDKEDVREAAKQSLMLCGEDGKLAHRRLEESLDSLPRIFAPGSMASTAF